jgi:hypothetical protein
MAGVPLGQRHHQAQVGLQHVVPGPRPVLSQPPQIPDQLRVQHLTGVQLPRGQHPGLDPQRQRHLLLGAEQRNLADPLQVVLHRVRRSPRNTHPRFRLIGDVRIREHEPPTDLLRLPHRGGDLQVLLEDADQIRLQLGLQADHLNPHRDLKIRIEPGTLRIEDERWLAGQVKVPRIARIHLGRVHCQVQRSLRPKVRSALPTGPESQGRGWPVIRGTIPG